MTRLVLLAGLIAAGFAAEAAQTNLEKPPSTCTFTV